MVYSLLEGLTALAAFGILIIGNERLCNLFRSSIEEDNRELVKFWKNKYSASFIYLAIRERIGNFLPIIGVLYLAGVPISQTVSDISYRLLQFRELAEMLR